MLITKGWVVRNFRSLLAQGHELDDLHQEAEIAALTQPERPHIPARRRLLDIARGRPYSGSKRKPWGQSAPSLTLDDIGWAVLEERHVEMQDIETHIDVMRAVGTLPKGYRRIVVLRIWEQYTFEEIAKEIGVAKSYVLKQWHEEIAPALRVELQGVAA